MFKVNSKDTKTTSKCLYCYFWTYFLLFFVSLLLPLNMFKCFLGSCGLQNATLSEINPGTDVFQLTRAFFKKHPGTAASEFQSCCSIMEHDKKLNKLKKDFIQSLKAEAYNECVDLRLKAASCWKAAWFSPCFSEFKAFYDCYSKRFDELKEENKELLEFKIKWKRSIYSFEGMSFTVRISFDLSVLYLLSLVFSFTGSFGKLDYFIAVAYELKNLLNIGSWRVVHIRQKQVQGYYKNVEASKIKNKMTFAIILCSAVFMETVCIQRPSQHSLIQSQQWKQKNNKRSLFRVYNKDTRVTLLTSFKCLHS